MVVTAVSLLFALLVSVTDYSSSSATAAATNLVDTAAEIAIRISIEPSNSIVEDTPVNVSCILSTSSPVIDIFLRMISASSFAALDDAQVLAQITFTDGDYSTWMETALESRLRIVENGNVVIFAFNHATNADSGLYFCDADAEPNFGRSQSIQLAVNENSRTITMTTSQTDGSVFDGNVNGFTYGSENVNTMATKTYVDVMANSQRPNAAMFNLALVIAGVATSVTMISIVALMLRLRFGQNFIKCRKQSETGNGTEPNSEANRREHQAATNNDNENAIDKPPLTFV